MQSSQIPMDRRPLIKKRLDFKHVRLLTDNIISTTKISAQKRVLNIINIFLNSLINFVILSHFVLNFFANKTSHNFFIILLIMDISNFIKANLTSRHNGQKHSWVIKFFKKTDKCIL